MAWDLLTGRLRAGIAIGDSSKDTEIGMAMDASLALIEKYCDRHFLYKEVTEEFTHVRTQVSLNRYPIDVIETVTGTMGEINKLNGILDVSPSKKLTVRYKGGYAVLPAELEMAFWSVFDAVHAAGATTGPTLSGGIKKLQITGVGSIDYDTSSGESSPSGGAFGGLVPMLAVSILDLYRRELA